MATLAAQKQADDCMHHCYAVVQRKGNLLPVPKDLEIEPHLNVAEYLLKQRKQISKNTRGYQALEYAERELRLGNWGLATHALKMCCLDEPDTKEVTANV